MNQKRRIWLLLLLALLLALAACAPAEIAATNADAVVEPTAEATQTPAATITLTDMAGREVALDEPATRVVALSAADCEILYAIGAGDTLVGRGEYCDYPEAVLSAPAVQSGMETNIEQIIALEPQVLIMTVMAQSEEQVAQLEAAGIRVVVSDAQDIEGVYTAIRMLGALTGADENAEALIEQLTNTFAALSARTDELAGKTVYFEVSPLQYGLWTAGAGTFMDEIATLIGLTNVFHDVSGWAAVSEEQVLAADPDLIVTIAMYYGDGPTPEEEILARIGWQGMTAVQNGAILNLWNNELSRPGPRLGEGAQALFDFALAAAPQDGE